MSTGQDKARRRYNTQEQGDAFDKKKTTYLTDQAQTFLAQQAWCVVAGLDTRSQITGGMLMERVGFVQVLNAQTCFLWIETVPKVLQRVYQGGIMQLGLLFLNHTTRERLCIQGEAELLSDGRIQVRVRQAFFHCNKYIRTNIPGLTSFVPHTSALVSQQGAIDFSEMCDWIGDRTLCFLCTVDHDGKAAVNHRSGSPGFLVPYGQMLLLPDYPGNGAFEALGNILETEQAALVIPDYVAQCALLISGGAHILEMKEVPGEVRRRCSGAERVVAIKVERLEVQSLQMEGIRACMVSFS